MAFNAYRLIQKKRDGQILSSEEISWLVRSYTDNTLPDYQMSALLMAIFFRGLDKGETAALTDAMLYSGSTLTFRSKKVIDKHSTGGVGDKTSFILAPIAAACGVQVPMMAGRGLGHTGGTVDKVEAISGFRVGLSKEEFQEQVGSLGLALIGQTQDIAPADKKIYALRDVTATVESIPLITASIMSKKLAEGANGIVMDIKCGNGAFMKDLAGARALAKSLRDTASRFNRKMVTIISHMSDPLGEAVGNSLELLECFDVLEGKGPADTRMLSLKLAAAMISMAYPKFSLAESFKRAEMALDSGKALKLFKKMLLAQGADKNIVDNPKLLPVATEETSVRSSKNGHIHLIDTQSLGLHCVDLGGGRRKVTDKIDYAVGLKIFKKTGDRVSKGEEMVKIIHHPHQKDQALQMAKEMIGNDFVIKSKPMARPKFILETKNN